jgi:hypothetical protein
MYLHRSDWRRVSTWHHRRALIHAYDHGRKKQYTFKIHIYYLFANNVILTKKLLIKGKENNKTNKKLTFVSFRAQKNVFTGS